jgi:hypothetical protein
MSPRLELDVTAIVDKAIRNEIASRSPELDVLGEVWRERRRQDEKWGEQNHPDVPTPRSITTTPRHMARVALGIPTASSAKSATDTAAANGRVTWGHIATEELAEAVEAAAEGDAEALRTELVQLAAVCVQWVQAIDRRPAGPQSGNPA